MGGGGGKVVGESIGGDFVPSAAAAALAPSRLRSATEVTRFELRTSDLRAFLSILTPAAPVGL
jgi:hypothetical protein